MTTSGTSRMPTDYSHEPVRSASIPLVAEQDVDRTASIGTLVKDASTHLSTLVRSELELAKLELTASVKQGLRGSIFFAAAAAIALFSLFFFWFMIGEIIAIWLPRWAAFTIVFFVMLAMAGALGFLGLKRVKKIGKPEKTISSLSDTASALKHAAAHDSAAPDSTGQGRARHAAK